MRLLIRESNLRNSSNVGGLASENLTQWSGSRSRISTFSRRFVRNRGALVGFAILSVLVFLALFPGLVAPHAPEEQNVEAAYQGPSLQHLFGTDSVGRDIVSRIIFGTRISLEVGLISIAIAGSFGISLGLVSGYYGGLIDSIGMRVVDIMLAFPGILLALVMVAILGTSLTNLMIAIGIGSISGFARLTRGCVLSIREEPYVDSARVVGCRASRIVRVYILPNTLSSLIVYGTLGVASAILTGAALSFLGLGVQRPSPEWGVMLSDGRDYLQEFWWMATFPGLAILVTTLAINMVGDGLRDVFDPRLYRD